MPDLDAGPTLDEAEVGRVFRQEYGRCVATLIRNFGDIDIAEDAVQEAFAVALGEWASDGVPPNPGGWITTTARNRAIDRLHASRVAGSCLRRWGSSRPATMIPAFQRR